MSRRQGIAVARGRHPWWIGLMVLAVALAAAGCSFSLTIRFDTEKAKVREVLSDFSTAWEAENAGLLRTTLGPQITVVTTSNQYNYYNRDQYVAVAQGEWALYTLEQYEIRNWSVDFNDSYTSASVDGQLYEKRYGGNLQIIPVRISLTQSSGDWEIVRIDYYAGGGHPFSVKK